MPKLVRDKIPEIMKKAGKDPKIHIADDEEYFQSLKNKLDEEVLEFKKESNTNELADIKEVINALAEYMNIDNLEEIRIKKQKERGGFKKRIILE